MHKLFAHYRFGPSLESTVQAGLWLLIALMPFHAFLSVWLGGWAAPRPAVQAWKEVVIVILALLAAALVWRQPQRFSRLKQSWLIVAGMFTVVAILVSLAAQVSPAQLIWGAKTDLELFVVAAVATVVSTRRFIRVIVTTLFLTAGVVSVFAVIQAFLLPPAALTAIGYGPDTIPPFLTIVTPDGPIYRFSSTLGGPNQLGAFLILPALLALSLGLTRQNRAILMSLPLWLLASWQTYSRSAWLGLVAAGTALVALGIRPTLKRFALAATAAILVGVSTFGLYVISPDVRTALVRGGVFGADPAMSSDAQHAASLLEGWQAMVAAPAGRGLGTAGPATFNIGQTVIIENQFLQVGYETGVLGALLYIVTFGLLVWRLARMKTHHYLAKGLGAAVIGLFAAGMALPVLTDSTLAICLGILAGALTAPLSSSTAEGANA